MLFSIYTILVILQQNKGMTTVVPDPCPSDIFDDIVTDMCKLDSTMEEANSGSYKVDSVVIRIMIQQDNCICRVTMDKQIQPVSIGLRKYGGLIASAPVKYGCGLAVDINHIPDMSTGNVIDPIECDVNSEPHNITLLQNSTLQFKSRIINGNFTRGYCMQIQRNIKSNPAQILRIHCDVPTTTLQTTEKATTSDPPQSSPQTTNVKHLQITTTTDPTTGLEQTAYIAIGAGSGVALILLVVLVLICLRRKSTHKAETNGNLNNSYLQEESEDKLPDNVFYVPATEFDFTGGNYSTVDVDTARSSNKRLSMEGNYSTVDVDTRISSNTRFSIEANYTTVDDDTGNSSNERYSVEGNYSTVDEDIPKSSTNRLSMGGNYSTVELEPKPTSSCINIEKNRSPDQNIKHITPPNGSDNVYAVVDKSSKNVPRTIISKGEGTCQPDQTYAVVDKAWKRNGTNKKKFEMNYGKKI